MSNVPDTMSFEDSSAFFRERWNSYHQYQFRQAESNRYIEYINSASDLLTYDSFYLNLEGIAPHVRRKDAFRSRWQTLKSALAGSGRRKLEVGREENEWRPLTLWFPGCGTSIGPSLYAALGHTVWASDISPIAIDYQRRRPTPREALAKLKARFGSSSRMAVLLNWVLQSPHPAGQLYLLEHDFRTPFPVSGFDTILNMRSYQIVPRPYWGAVAKVHWDALRDGGRAYFDTINVGREQDREALEGALSSAGFRVYTSWNAPAEPNETTKRAIVIYRSG